MDLLETLTQTVPKHGPKAQALFSDAEQKLQMLESSGSSRAGIIRQQLADAISKGQNPSNLIKGLDKIYYSSLGRSEKSATTGETRQKESKGVAPEEALIQIENALNLGDERGIKLPSQEIKSAAMAFGRGDLKTATKVAGRLSKNIEDAMKLQNEEDKDIRTTAEGLQVAVGKKTGTIYTGGVPASRGRENTNVFTSFLGEERKKDIATVPFAGSVMQALPEGLTPTPEISQLETVQPRPELYTQPTKPEGETGLPKTTEYIAKARELYMNGDLQGAFDILNATNLPSVYGPIDAKNIVDIIGVQPQQAIPQPAQQVPQPNKTSKGTQFQILPD